jgi:hypothetical protein
MLNTNTTSGSTLKKVSRTERERVIKSYRDYLFNRDTSDQVKLLISEAEIKEEGLAMGHCVGLYAQSVKDKKYLVYSLRNPDGTRHSTLGFSVFHSRDSNDTSLIERKVNETIDNITLGQHYGRYNSSELKQEARELEGFLELNLYEFVETCKPKSGFKTYDLLWKDELNAEKL